MHLNSMPSPENFTPAIVYLPCLHRELASGPVPEEVFFLNPGLPLSPDAAKGERIWTPDGLPYDPPKAAHCLRDLIAEGESLGHDLLFAAANPGGTDAFASSAASPFDSSEKAALRAFEQTGAYAPQVHTGKADLPSPEAAREQAQKLLLLCAHLENNILAACELAQKINAGEAALQELLQGSDAREKLEDVVSQGAIPADDDLLGRYLARWPEITRAWRELLPAGVVFYTVDLNALPGLEATAAQALPPEEAARLFPVSAATGWTFIALRPEEFCGEVRLVSGCCPQPV